MSWSKRNGGSHNICLSTWQVQVKLTNCWRIYVVSSFHSKEVFIRPERTSSSSQNSVFLSEKQVWGETCLERHAMSSYPLLCPILWEERHCSLAYRPTHDPQAPVIVVSSCPLRTWECTINSVGDSQVWQWEEIYAWRWFKAACTGIGGPRHLKNGSYVSSEWSKYLSPADSLPCRKRYSRVWSGQGSDWGAHAQGQSCSLTQSLSTPPGPLQRRCLKRNICENEIENHLLEWWFFKLKQPSRSTADG